MTRISKRLNAVLSNYPLSQAFKEKLAEEVGPDAVWLTVTELRQSSVLAMIRQLRARRF